MTARIRNITMDCQAWEPLVDFWSQVGDFDEDPENPNSPGDPEGLLLDRTTGIHLVFIPVPEPKAGKNRVHLDLQPQGTTRDEEVERLLGIGAAFVADHRRADGSGFVQLADPQGNEFCVERSTSERSAE